MQETEDYYQILGVAPEADLESIRSAFRSKAHDYHPDGLGEASEAVRNLAEEQMKAVNRAYETLGESARRRSYDKEWVRVFSPPRPEVDPPCISFRDVTPGHLQTSTFVIRNAGGAFTTLRLNNPDSWVKISGYESLSDTDELPLQVDIEADVHEWGTTYVERITVALDQAVAELTVELTTKEADKSPDWVGPVGGQAPLAIRFARLGPECAEEGAARVLFGFPVLGAIIMGLMGAYAMISTVPFVGILFAPFAALFYAVLGAAFGVVPGVVCAGVLRFTLGAAHMAGELVLTGSQPSGRLRHAPAGAAFGMFGLALLGVLGGMGLAAAKATYTAYAGASIVGSYFGGISMAIYYGLGGAAAGIIVGGAAGAFVAIVYGSIRKP